MSKYTKLGILLVIIAIFWGIIDRDSILIIGGIALGISTYLHYKIIVKQRSE